MRTVTIDGKEIEMMANAGTPVYHQRIFKEDILIELDKAIDSKKKKAPEPHEILAVAAVIGRLGFTMAMQAKHAGKEEALFKMDAIDYAKWCSQFEDPQAITNAAFDILAIYQNQQEPTAEAKKEDAPQTDR